MNVVLYARVSSEKQDVDLSVAAQLKALRDFAAKQGYTVVREFIDEAESGRTAARPAFREMIATARRVDRPFDLILVWKYSRFARSREDSILFKTMLRKNGVQVISINEPADDTPTGRLLEAIIESLDEFYSDNLGEEVTRGMRESASRGFYLSPRAPYGYRKIKVQDGSRERVKLEIEPNEASVVASLFESVLGGQGLTEIVKGLNAKGIPGATKRGWSKTTLHTILTNEAYSGTLVWGRNSKRGLQPVVARDACPAIVARDTFERVQSLLRERAPARINPRRVASRFLLSGLARCGHCGKALVGQDAKGGQFSYYICGTLNKKGAGSCPAPYLNSTKFERLVIDNVKRHILTLENLTELVTLVNEELDRASRGLQDEVDVIEDSLADIEGRLGRLYDAIESGDIDLNDLKPRIRELRSQQDKLLSRLAEVNDQLSERRVELASPEVVSRYVEDMHTLLSQSSLPERRVFIRSFVREVKVTGQEVLLTYTMPLSADGVTEETAGVLPTVRHGGQYWI